MLGNVNHIILKLDANSKTVHADIDKLISNVKKELNVAKNSLLAKVLSKLDAENTDLKDKIIELQKVLGYAKPIQPLESETSIKTDGTSKKMPIIRNPLLEEAKKEEKPTTLKPKAAQPAGKSTSVADDQIDVGRLDLRVGRIVEAKKHPDADALYVETIDLGEENPRTVVSGLVRFIPLEQMLNRLVICVCNLKPAKMRGVESQAMVLCASTPDKVEIMEVDPSCKPGDRLTCEPAFVTRPDVVLNPKKKVWETVAVDLKVSANGEAVYKNEVLKVNGVHPIWVPTLRDVPVK